MKTPITIISSDWHLSRNNIDQIKDLVRQKIELAVKYNIKDVFCLGDVFNSRKSQEEVVLNSFGIILDMFMEANIRLICIPGNHDKVNLNSKESYLTPFKNYPNFYLIEDFGGVVIDKIMFNMLPYFEEELYIQKLAELEQFLLTEKNDRKQFLLTHQALSGAINNNSSKVENDITTNKFDYFDKVLVGHYHNRVIQDKVYYIGSICQNNFGEDIDKGFTLVYSNGTIDFFKPITKEFQKISIDIDNISHEELKLKIQGSLTKENVVYRFELIGDNSKLNSLDIETYKSMGVDIKLKNKESVINIESAINNERVEFTNDLIVDEFVKFCGQENIEDIELGKNYLNKIL